MVKRNAKRKKTANKKKERKAANKTTKKIMNRRKKHFAIVRNGKVVGILYEKTKPRSAKGFSVVSTKNLTESKLNMACRIIAAMAA